ncbi:MULTISPECIES: hypothetical protein [Pseudonocardia]|uniref:Uncharacterized protein n=2 Tax=Pseudonocardia TaxID=1847 RepID=A0A1Y2MY67_PSEAH|nr:MULTISPECIES: hypothetical protein [Pseudonocardia]OSY40115.1 hypothetical protein BG845_02938 [Pseudonocardia autotrophica]TDN72939.1 hypothetical protein C8E95_2010 [Pseudonocardia autotrophica]BBG03659.1 hypothetical protein Pdca_48680 [Pseudonocardia autotrophica]GEC26357.1 hypothetical protein PSA01_33860 [Pseudonocardia saturnea]
MTDRRPQGGTVLIALTSADHRTLRAAAEIGHELSVAGLRPLITTAGDVSSLAGVRAVVLGGAWDRPWARAAARRFLRRHSVVLRVRPLWMFDAAPLLGPVPRPHPGPAPELELRAPVQAPGADGWGSWAAVVAAELATGAAPELGAPAAAVPAR